MSVDLGNLVRLPEHEVLTGAEARVEFAAGRAVLLAAAALCGCGGERCGRCNSEKLHGHTPRSLYRPEEWTIDGAVVFWKDHERAAGEPLFLRAEDPGAPPAYQAPPDVEAETLPPAPIDPAGVEQLDLLF